LKDQTARKSGVFCTLARGAGGGTPLGEAKNPMRVVFSAGWQECRQGNAAKYG